MVNASTRSRLALDVVLERPELGQAELEQELARRLAQVDALELLLELPWRSVGVSLERRGG